MFGLMPIKIDAKRLISNSGGPVFLLVPQWWGVSEIGFAFLMYVFAVVGSSGFHTHYSQFSHAFGDRVLGSSVAGV